MNRLALAAAATVAMAAAPTAAADQGDEKTDRGNGVANFEAAAVYADCADAAQLLVDVNRDRLAGGDHCAHVVTFHEAKVKYRRSREQDALRGDL